MYYVYMLRCEDESLYIGITTDVKRRFSEHFSGESLSAKYTRSRKAKSVEAVWSCETRSLASKLEYRLKKLKHKQKGELAKSPSLLDNILGDTIDSTLFSYQPSLLISCDDTSV